MKVLIVGGTRNVGHLLTLALLEAGHQVTVFNRGQTVDELTSAVTRFHGDRNAPAGLAQALAAADYDTVVDMVLYDGAQATQAVAQLAGRTGHYLFISTGQVYLVREGLPRPFVEEDYDVGTPVPEPEPGTYDHGEWLYGVDKRAAEDVLARAWQDERFPVTTLRLPMVNSERDHFLRLYNYLLRIRDGGPILVPDAPQYPLRHVYGDDVVRAILALLARGPGRGEVFNISQDETISLSAWLAMLADCAGEKPAPSWSRSLVTRWSAPACCRTVPPSAIPGCRSWTTRAAKLNSACAIRRCPIIWRASWPTTTCSSRHRPPLTASAAANSNSPASHDS